MDLSRYIDTVELQFTVEFITPTFLGGADSNAEIRTAPFKFGIRYWWRILYGAKYLSENRLKETEDNIFGSAGGKTETHKSNIQIRIDNKPTNYTEKSGFPNGKKISVMHAGKSMGVNILDYLAYGKFDYIKGSGNVYNVTHIKQGTRFDIIILIKKTEHLSEIMDASLAFLKYGTVGSRSRNGFGSMNIISSSVNHTNEPVKFSKKVIKSDKLLDFPMLSSQCHFYTTKQLYKTWEEALSELGIVYKDARCSLENRHTYIRRGFVSRPIEVKNEIIPPNIRKDRIPKPFYMGVMKQNNGYVGYIICLPIQFYEREAQDKYMSVIKEMNQRIASKMNDVTNNFFNSLIGGVK